MDRRAFLGGLLLGPEGLRALGDGGERLTDDSPNCLAALCRWAAPFDIFYDKVIFS